MEITINIPKNTYSTPTEIRKEVVELICLAFIEGGCDRVFHPYNGSRAGCRPASLCAYRKPRGIDMNGNPVLSKGWFYGFESEERCKEHRNCEFYRIHGSEMVAAFKALREAGWHIFRYYEYREWMGYRVCSKPYFEGCTEVSEFTDFID